MAINLIPTEEAEHLARNIVNDPEIGVFYLDENRDGKLEFPDGESYIRLSRVKELANSSGDRTVILHAGMPNPNSGLVQLEQLICLLRDAGIKHVEVFFTYFAYGMQDKAFYEGEVNVAKDIFNKLVNYYGVKKITVLDPHFFGADWLEEFPFENVTAVPLLMERAAKDYDDVLFVAPDAGSQKRTNLKGLNKTRSNSFEVDVEHDEEFAKGVKGKVVGVVDDLIETGGTMARLYDKCLECCATEAIALITHGVLPAGIKRISKKYAKVYLTNSINRPEAVVDISPLIAETIKKG